MHAHALEEDLSKIWLAIAIENRGSCMITAIVTQIKYKLKVLLLWSYLGKEKKREEQGEEK